MTEEEILRRVRPPMLIQPPIGWPASLLVPGHITYVSDLARFPYVWTEFFPYDLAAYEPSA